MTEDAHRPVEASRAADLLNKAVVDLVDGKPEDARPQLERAVALYEDMQDPFGKAMACYNLGIATLNEGDAQAALGWFSIATQLFMDSGWPTGESLSAEGAANASAVTDS